MAQNGLSKSTSTSLSLAKGYLVPRPPAHQRQAGRLGRLVALCGPQRVSEAP